MIDLVNLKYTKTNTVGIVIDEKNPNAAWADELESTDEANDRWLFFLHPQHGWCRVHVKPEEVESSKAFNIMYDIEDHQPVTEFFTSAGLVIDNPQVAYILLKGQALVTKTGVIFFMTVEEKAHYTTFVHTLFIANTDSRLNMVKKLRNLYTLNSMYGRKDLNNSDRAVLFKRVGFEYVIK